MIQNENILTPSEGKWLTNGETFSQQVWLGINDTKENWYEINDSEVPDEWKINEITEELGEPL